MPVLGRPTLKRQDLTLSIVSDQSIGFRWWQSSDGGKTRTPADLTGVTGVAELRSVDGTVWESIPLTISTHPDDPYVGFTTTPDFFTTPEWGARRNGEYSFILTGPDDAVTQLATGYLYLSR